MTPDRGLLVDWGGVMTTNLDHSFSAFCAGEGLEPGALLDRLRGDAQCRELVIALETGDLEEPDMATVHHVESERTIDELERLLEVPLR